MATIFYDQDADLSVVQGRKVAVMGYGSQGHAHALNLRDSGVDVRVGLPPGARLGRGRTAAGPHGAVPAEAAAWADLIVVLVPDTSQPALYRDAILPNLAPGKTMLFAHGFNIRFGTITPPADVDVVDGGAEVAGPSGP